MKAKTVPLGKAINDDDETLDMLALISVEDIELAKADGRAKMRPKGGALLEAQKATDAADVAAPFLPGE